jgi:hypothetical protein
MPAVTTEEINHGDRAHALLSASGASRWMKCTPSARLEDPYPSKSSVHAEEGTLAHEFADIELKKSQGILSEEAYTAKLLELRSHDLYTEDMEEHVSVYTDYVLEQLSASKGGTLIIEEKVNFSAYVPEGYGTCDAIILPIAAQYLNPNEKFILCVTDLKYGKGVQVDAEDNPQLKLYALGAYLRYSLTHGIDIVRLTIVQPRLDHISTWDISVEDLLIWAKEELAPLAKKAHDGEGELKAGSHCRFCKVAPKCRALYEHSIEAAKMEFSDKNEPDILLSDKELAELYLQIPVIKEWINAVHNYMHDQALSGKKYPGLKLVEGRSNRIWKDQEKVIETLRDNIYPESQIFTHKLNGITAMEKLMGKVQFKEILGNLWVKPPGKPSLVSEDDSRPSMGTESAIRDFT